MKTLGSLGGGHFGSVDSIVSYFFAAILKAFEHIRGLDIWLTAINSQSSNR
jgi:hypothetical protein